MQEWLTQALEKSAQLIPEEAEGFVLGRGLPAWLYGEMRVGVWRTPETSSPDQKYAKLIGSSWEGREGWLTVPFWSPRGVVLGVEFRTIELQKKVWEYRLPSAKWNPVFMGLTSTTFQKIWEGGDVWLVEGVFDLSLSHAVPERDVVLACGTAHLSANQLNFLVRFLSSSATVHVCFDEDPSGRRAVEGYIDDDGKRRMGVLELLKRVHLRGRDVRYRGGKDPGEIWERGGKPALTTTFKVGD